MQLALVYFCTVLYERASVHTELLSVNCEFAFSECNASAKHWQKDAFLIESNFSSDTTLVENYIYIYIYIDVTAKQVWEKIQE